MEFSLSLEDFGRLIYVETLKQKLEPAQFRNGVEIKLNIPIHQAITEDSSFTYSVKNKDSKRHRTLAYAFCTNRTKRIFTFQLEGETDEDITRCQRVCLDNQKPKVRFSSGEEKFLRPKKITPRDLSGSPDKKGYVPTTYRSPPPNIRKKLSL